MAAVPKLELTHVKNRVNLILIKLKFKGTTRSGACGLIWLNSLKLKFQNLCTKIHVSYLKFKMSIFHHRSCPKDVYSFKLKFTLKTLCIKIHLSYLKFQMSIFHCLNHFLLLFHSWLTVSWTFCPWSTNW